MRNRILRQKCILIIDDNASFRALLRLHLEKGGFKVFEAEDGPAGLELFLEQRFDAVLIDLYLPGMDGHAVLAELADRSGEIPLIVISGEGGMRDAIRSVRKGAWDFLVKDDRVLEELDHALSKCLERASYLLAQRQRLEYEIRERERAEEALRTQLDFLQAIIDAVPNQIFYKDLEGRYLGCNKAFEELTGVACKDLVGGKPQDFAPKEEGEVYRQKDAEMLQGGVTVQEYEQRSCWGVGSAR